MFEMWPFNIRKKRREAQQAAYKTIHGILVRGHARVRELEVKPSKKHPGWWCVLFVGDEEEAGAGYVCMFDMENRIMHPGTQSWDYGYLKTIYGKG